MRASVRGPASVHAPEASTCVSSAGGWDNDPACNLYNQEGLPASPFRTDDWEK